MFKINTVQAHCDIPCKVYDPSVIQYSALSIVRFMDLINFFQYNHNRGEL